MKSSFGVKAVFGVVGAGVIYLVLAHFNLVPSAMTQKAAVPQAVDLHEAPDVTPSEAGTVAAVALPTTKPAAVKGTAIRVNIWAWNAQMGLLFANGGPRTTVGSLMESHGVNLTITRQDDTEKSKAGQMQLAQAVAGGNPNPSEGVHFVLIMGDGAAQYLASINKALERLGPEYVAEIVGAIGYSRGEDVFMGPQEWKDNPQAMKGGGVAGVLRDGDWNLAQYKLANDGIKNNPDETTFDPDALNWFAAPDYLKAAELYIAGYCEDRPVVKDGRKTGGTHRLCVDGVVTWTPGDVNIAKKKGGLVRLISTKENVYQMPSVVIGIRKWNQQHAKAVTEFLAAALDGGDQVRTHEAALSRAGQAAYAVYAEESAAYWVKYYKGVTERDKTGIPVPLGGSSVMNLADNLVLFGLADGAGGVDSSLFKATYEGFGNVAKQQYPRLVPAFPPAAEAVNLTYLKTLASQHQPSAESADVQRFDEGGPIARENIVAQRNWNIQFETGQATFTPAAERTMAELYNQLAIGGGLAVQVDGHTDNVGNPDANKALSERRAFAVKQWLETKAPTLFPCDRQTGSCRIAVRAFGDTAPIAPNDTPAGRAVNRRVTIILGAKG